MVGVLTTFDWTGTWNPGIFNYYNFFLKKQVTMVKIESLPKVISINDDWYALNLHVTFKNKLAIGYQYSAGFLDAVEKKIPYNIFSSVVEPDMKKDTIISYGTDVLEIVDVPTLKLGVETLYNRVQMALRDKTIEIEVE